MPILKNLKAAKEYIEKAKDELNTAAQTALEAGQDITYGHILYVVEQILTAATDELENLIAEEKPKEPEEAKEYRLKEPLQKFKEAVEE